MFTLKLFTILVILIKCSFSLFFGKTGEFMKKYLPSLSQISLKIIIVQAPTIPHFKGLGMRNLQYEIRICQKSHNKVTMTVYVMVRFLMNQTLLPPFYRLHTVFPRIVSALLCTVTKGHST